jgi:aryl-alcohol dehydrogenase-like predicted oxidoreductase
VAERLHTLEAVREVLTSGGRTLAQGALGWLWARSVTTVPIPGFKTVEQVEDNVGALGLGPLSGEQMAALAALLPR